jgi:hypothetical protein
MPSCFQRPRLRIGWSAWYTPVTFESLLIIVCASVCFHREQYASVLNVDQSPDGRSPYRPTCEVRSVSVEGCASVPIRRSALAPTSLGGTDAKSLEVRALIRAALELWANVIDLRCRRFIADTARRFGSGHDRA